MSSAGPHSLSWIFLDIGNVIWSDDAGDLFTLRNIGRELGREGTEADPAALEAAERRAIDAYAPSVWRSVIWQFSAGDRERYERIAAAVRGAWDAIDAERYRAFTQPFPGVVDMIAELRAAGYCLGLASNNSPRALARLAELDLLEHFDQHTISENLGLAKPDTRFFLHLLEAADCPASRAVMVGDRLCNDIAPARMIGMRTLRVLKGWHRDQLPRSPLDLPDGSVAEPAEIPAALAALSS